MAWLAAKRDRRGKGGHDVICAFVSRAVGLHRCHDSHVMMRPSVTCPVSCPLCFRLCFKRKERRDKSPTPPLRRTPSRPTRAPAMSGRPPIEIRLGAAVRRRRPEEERATPPGRPQPFAPFSADGAEPPEDESPAGKAPAQKAPAQTAPAEPHSHPALDPAIYDYDAALDQIRHARQNVSLDRQQEKLERKVRACLPHTHPAAFVLPSPYLHRFMPHVLFFFFLLTISPCLARSPSPSTCPSSCNPHSSANGTSNEQNPK